MFHVKDESRAALLTRTLIAYIIALGEIFSVVTTINKSRGLRAMMIDFHVHAFPDKVAAKAIESLQAIYGAEAFSDGSVDGLLSNMACANRPL